jgi:hypothetical protein
MNNHLEQAFQRYKKTSSNHWRISSDKMVTESDELHQMRYFFPQGLALFLSQCGLKLESLTAFSSLDCPADETTWNVLGVAE